MILILLAGSSGQSILIALHQFYHLSWLRPVQPVTAAILPPLAYLAFVSSTRRRLLWHCDLWHALPVGFVLFCVLLFPQALDTAIPAIFLIYGSALLHSLHQGGDSLILTRLDSDNIPLRLWQFIAAALLVSSFGEIVISLAHASGPGTWQPMIGSALSSLTLLALGALGLSPHLHLANDAKNRTSRANPTHRGRHRTGRAVADAVAKRPAVSGPGSDSKPPCPTLASAGQRPVKCDQSNMRRKRLAVRQPSQDCPFLQAAKARSKYHQRFVRQRLSDQIKF